MPYTEIIGKIEESITDMPEQTQLSVAVIQQGTTKFYGAIKDDGNILSVSNATAAYEIGSVTKAFTGNVLAQLIIEKRVRLDDEIQQFLPFTLLNNPPITLGQLAWHTSGLPRTPHDFEEQENYDKDNPFKNYTEQQLATYLSQHLQVEHAPGEKHLYSNLGSGLLSYIISRIEGKPFAKVVAEKIFKPLQMVNASFDVYEVQTEMVQGIDENGNFCAHWDGGILDGCLGIIATAEDMAKFAMMIMDPSNAAASLQVTTTFTVDEHLKSNLGMGERLIIPGNIRMQGINGGTGGYGASLLLNRQKACGVVILTNMAPVRYMEIMYPLGRELLVALSVE